MKFKGTGCGGGKSVRKGREVEEEVIQRDGSDGWTAVCRGTGRLPSLGSIPRRWAEPSVRCVLPLPCQAVCNNHSQQLADSCNRSLTPTAAPVSEVARASLCNLCLAWNFQVTFNRRK